MTVNDGVNDGRSVQPTSTVFAPPLGNRLRVLVLGPIDHVHTEHLALGANDRGFDVVVAGELWGETPEPDYGVHGIAVSKKSWPTARWLQDLISRFRPHVIHANWFPDVFLYLLYGAAPLIAMAWGSDIYRASRLGRWQNRFVVRRAEMVMADSVDLLEQLQALGASAERSALLNWGVDISLFSPSSTSRVETRRRLGLPTGPMILSPRSLREVYNPRTIIEAFELLAETHPDLHLVLKHIHEDEPELGPLRYPDRVHRIGFVPYERMRDYYRAADVCVSIASSDSSPRSVWEAMACGTPCVISDLPWVHELVRDERDALVVPIEARPVADAIDRVLSEPQLVFTMARQARSLVEDHRDRERELDRLAAIYERMAITGAVNSVSARALRTLGANVGERVALIRRRAGGGA